eukprot:s5453_g5.t7
MLGAFVEVLSVESASPEAQSPSEKVIPRLMNTALQDKVPHVQLAAIRVLEALSGRIGAAEYAAQLAGALQSEHVAARWGAMRALRALGTDAMTTYARELAILVLQEHSIAKPNLTKADSSCLRAVCAPHDPPAPVGILVGCEHNRPGWSHILASWPSLQPSGMEGRGSPGAASRCRAICDESYFCADSTTRSRGPRVLEVIQRTHPERLSLLDGYAPTEEDKESYFKQYGCLEEQMTMLQDSVRMQAYRNAIETSVADFRDKVVLDVGCGTGVLAIFAAKAGARKVYAVEASDMASAAKQVVAANGVDKVVEVIRGMVETIELPEKVDVIISEWMGNFLLKESMLDTVLIARDRFLKPGGLLFPSHARLFLAPCAHSCFAERWQSYVDELWAWRSFVQHMHVSFGLSYGPLTTQQEKEASEHHLQSWDWVHLNSSHLRGPPVQLLALDLATLPLSRLQSLHEQAFDIVLPITKDGTVGGLCGFFDISFQHVSGESEFVDLSTSPFSKATHWGQQLFGFFPESVDLFGPPAQLGLAVLQGDELCGRWRLGRVAQTRDFRLEVELNHTSANGLLGSYHEAWYV